MTQGRIKHLNTLNLLDHFLVHLLRFIKYRFRSFKDKSKDENKILTQQIKIFIF